MKKSYLIIAAILVGALQSWAQTADDVIAKHVDAIGGREKVKAINTMKLSGLFDVGGGVQIPFTNYYTRPDKMKIEATFQGMTQQIVVDGDSGWQINPFMGSKDPEPMNGDQFKMMKQQADFEGHLVDFKDKGYTAEFLGQEDFEGSQVNKISLSNKDGEQVTYYLDAETNLLLRETQKLKMADNEVESETIYGDYKAESGVLMAHSMENKSPGQQGSQKITINTVEVNVPIDDAIFKMPPKSETTK
jgi:outer membrane lipoprotein-sorting protein